MALELHRSKQFESRWIDISCSSPQNLHTAFFIMPGILDVHSVCNSLCSQASACVCSHKSSSLLHTMGLLSVAEFSMLYFTVDFLQYYTATYPPKKVLGPQNVFRSPSQGDWLLFRFLSLLCVPETTVGLSGASYLAYLVSLDIPKRAGRL